MNSKNETSDNNNSQEARCHRFLILDDNPAAAETLSNSLEFFSQKADFCTTADDFYTRLNSEAPDIVVVDLIMPDADGTEVILNAHKIRPEAKVVLISGYGNRMLNSAAKTLMREGINMIGILEKPFTTKDIKRLLDSVPES